MSNVCVDAFVLSAAIPVGAPHCTIKPPANVPCPLVVERLSDVKMVEKFVPSRLPFTTLRIAAKSALTCAEANRRAQAGRYTGDRSTISLSPNGEAGRRN